MQPVRHVCACRRPAFRLFLVYDGVNDSVASNTQNSGAQRQTEGSKGSGRPVGCGAANTTQQASSAFGALVLQEECEEARQQTRCEPGTWADDQKHVSVVARLAGWRARVGSDATGGLWAVLRVTQVCGWTLFLPVACWGALGRCPPLTLLRPLNHRVDCAWRSTVGDWLGTCRTKKPGCKRACETRQLAQSAQFSCARTAQDVHHPHHHLQATEMAARESHGRRRRRGRRAREGGRHAGRQPLQRRRAKGEERERHTRERTSTRTWPQPNPARKRAGRQGRKPIAMRRHGGCLWLAPRATLARLALKDALLVHVRTAWVPLSALSSPSHPLSPSIFKRQPKPSSCPLSTGLRSCICPFHSLPTFIVNPRDLASPTTVIPCRSHRHTQSQTTHTAETPAPDNHTTLTTCTLWIASRSYPPSGHLIQQTNPLHRYPAQTTHTNQPK